MRSSVALLLAISVAVIPARVSAQDSTIITARARAAAPQLIAAAMADSAAWNRLAEMTDKFGNRLSGTDALEHTIDWALGQMRADGLENVRGEPAMVPHWVRGDESVELITPRRTNLPMLGLGMSVGTPAKGITARVIVVSTFDELTRRAAEAKGRIVLFDVPFTEYGETVAYRALGASAAAKVGAVAMLIRSVAPFSIRSPHTGALRYDTTVKKIPAAAITVEDAKMLHRMINRGDTVVVHLTMGAHQLPDRPSRNTIAEIRGSEKPDEVVVVSGHLDSWDVGQGAMDDGGGAVAAWEAVRLMKKLGLRPRRTIRVILWTNEENGTRGGLAYAHDHAAELAKHSAVIESDNGVFRPYGFAFGGSDSAYERLRVMGTLLHSIGADSVTKPGGETDIGPMMQAGVPGMGLWVEGEKYFWFHHTQGDTMDAVDPIEMAKCVASLAVMAFTIADSPQPLPR